MTPHTRSALLGLALATCAAPAASRTVPAALPSPPCCAVIELRQYTLHAGQRDALIELFEREFVDSQEAQGIHLIGTFRDVADPDRFVWLRGFADMPSRAAALGGFYDGPVWHAHRDAANATIVDSDNVLLLRATHAGPSAAIEEDLALPPADAREVPPSLIEARLFHLDAPPSASLIELIDAALVPVQRGAGAQPLGVLMTEPATNTFPRLPVREGEQVIAVFARLRDHAAYEHYLDTLSTSARWREAMAALHAHAGAEAEVLLLSPTARSRTR